jgi:hypothetical protein
MTQPISALVDAATSALLALSPYPYVVSYLAKSPPLEAEEYHGVNWPHYREKFPIKEGGFLSYPGWTWSLETRRFSRTPAPLVTPELKQRSLLAVKKCSALWEMVYELSVSRYAMWRGPILQETVYLAKRQQAQAYKDGGYPEGDILKYPFVLQYADLAGLTPRAAADEILFKARLDDELLARTEFLRLKYFNQLRDAAMVEEIEPILRTFRRETYRDPQF